MKPTKLKKQKVIKSLLQHAISAKKFNFCLFLGVGSENEPSFEYMNSSRVDEYIDKEIEKYICCLHRIPTSAPYYLQDTKQVQYLIQRLRISSQKKKRNRSQADLLGIMSPLTRKQANLKHENSNPNVIFLFVTLIS